MPVMLIFDAKSLLTNQGARFTNGNAASLHVEIGDTAAFLRTIPFAAIYDDVTFTESQRAEIIFHRNAEVIVPEPLPLRGNLLYVICRSPAEAETVRSLITTSHNADLSWFRDRVYANTQRSPGLKMFFKR